MERLGEKTQSFVELITVSSGTSGLTQGYSMEDCNQISFICGVGTVAGAATAITPLFTVKQSADAALSTNAVVAGATAICGPTTVNQLVNTRQATITISSAATDGETVVFTQGGVTYTLTASTAGASTIATALTFGSSLGATVAEGLPGRLNSLSSVINASTLGYFMTAATISTVALRLTAKDTASTGITVGTSAASVYSLISEKSHSQIDILEEDLDSTSKYVGVGISTATTAVAVSITIIKSGLRNSPAYQSAQAYKKST